MGAYVLTPHNLTIDRSCRNCTSGRFSNTTNAITCQEWKACPPGKFVTQSPSSFRNRECEACSQGTFTNVSNRSICYSCKPGMYEINIGQTLCSGLCSPGKYGSEAGEISESSACHVCPDNQIQEQSGGNVCIDCDVGKYTFVRDIVSSSYHDNKSTDCNLPPYLHSVSPQRISTHGNVTVFFFGSNFIPLATTTLAIGGTSWTVVTVHNSSVFSAVAESGIGQSLSIVFVMNGISGQSNTRFSFGAPIINHVIAPDLGGGTLYIFGLNFAILGGDINTKDVKVNVGGNGCKKSCTNVQVLSATQIQCQYDFKGVKGDCSNSVQVLIADRESNDFVMCYNGSRGELVLPDGTNYVAKEGENIIYKVQLNHVPVAAVNVKLIVDHPNKCSLSNETLVFPANSSEATTIEVVVKTITNYIDEGTIYAYTCKIVHTLESDDSQFEEAGHREILIQVMNINSADTKLVIIDAETKEEDDRVKFIGPLCVDEGFNVTYGVVLETEPMANVTIRPIAHLENTSWVMSPPRVSVTPQTVFFTALNWHQVQIITFSAIKDDVDNNNEKFRVSHDIETDDSTFLKKSNEKQMTVVVRVTDVDDAKILLGNQSTFVALVEDGDAKSVEVAGLSTEPLFDVSITVSVASDKIEVKPRTFTIERGEWRSVNKKITIRARSGIQDSESSITLVPSSKDPKYHGDEHRLSIPVQVDIWPRALVVEPKKGTVEEGLVFQYEASLTQAPWSIVVMNITTADSRCNLSSSLLIFTRANATSKRVISVRTRDNHFDEGKTVAYKCDIRHVLSSTGDTGYNRKSYTLSLDVENNDVAGSTLVIIDAETKEEDDRVKFIGPLCVDEGFNVTYGVVLETEPMANVTIRPIAHLENTSWVMSPPRVSVTPQTVFFTALNWHQVQIITFSAIKDDVDNNNEKFRVSHDIETDDSTFLKKSNEKQMTVVVRVTDVDDAKILLGNQSTFVALVEDGDAKSVEVAGLSTEPLFDVSITVSVASDKIEVKPRTFTIERGEWRSVNKKITIRARSGIQDSESSITLVPSSKDPKYHGDEHRLSIPVQVDKIWEPPKPKFFSVDQDFRSLAINLTDFVPKYTYIIRWSENKDKFNASDVIRVDDLAMFPYLLRFPESLSRVLYYVQLKRGSGNSWSPWSSLDEFSWRTSNDCKFGQYLDTPGGFPFQKWKCLECPEGAYCPAEITWEEVKPLFGWWRNKPWKEGDSINERKFFPCLFPPACLGGKNGALKGLYLSPDGTDPALAENSSEACNVNDGYATYCPSRDGSNEHVRCRLCSTCAKGYFKSLIGRDNRCDKCPDKTTNKWLIVLGSLLAVLILIGLIYNQVSKGGVKTARSNVKMIFITYFQLTYIISGMNIPWPNLLSSFFGVSTAISTMGEHLVRLECEFVDVPTAQFVYVKQLGYIFFLPGLSLLSTGVWFALAVCDKKKIRKGRVGGSNDKHPNMVDGSVSTIVYLAYLMYPSLCRQAFVLMTCTRVDNQLYMKADLQEPCYVGRHLSWFLLCSIPQICLHVLGIPLLGLYKVYKHRKKKQKMSKFRYGILYTPYSPRRWFWGVVVASRKAVTALITSLVDDPNLVVHFMVGYFAFALILNLWGEPYTGAMDMRLAQGKMLHMFDSMTLFVLTVTAWSGLFFLMLPSCDGELNWACSAILITLLFMHLVYIVYGVSIFKKAGGRRAGVSAERHRRQSRAFFCCCQSVDKKEDVVVDFQLNNMQVNPMNKCALRTSVKRKRNSWTKQPACSPVKITIDQPLGSGRVLEMTKLPPSIN